MIKSDNKALTVSKPLNLFWRHDCPVKPVTETWLSSGGNAVLVSQQFGKGQFTCLLTGLLGQADSRRSAFWESPAWAETMKQVVDLLHKNR